MASKGFSFTNAINDISGAIQKQTELIRPRVVFGHYWDGRITKAEEEMERLTDEQLKILVIQGNLMVSKAANVRQARDKAKEGKDDGVG